MPHCRNERSTRPVLVSQTDILSPIISVATPGNFEGDGDVVSDGDIVEGDHLGGERESDVPHPLGVIKLPSHAVVTSSATRLPYRKSMHSDSRIKVLCGSSQHSRSIKRSRRRSVRLTPHFIKTICLFSLPSVARAAPSTFTKRDGNVAEIIAPVVVVGVILLVAAIVIIARKGWHSRMAQWSTNAASAFGPSTNGTTELTAQQLAGDMAGGAGAPTIGAGRSRRRGNRRTPSQISTRSLPVYMKEPGEHEVVIYRGPDDMEDAPTTTNVVMPSVAESVAESPDLSLEESREQSQVYVAEPDSPHDMPLLSVDDSRTRSSLLPSGLRQSVDTLVTDESASALLHNRSPDIDPRGAAPAYFEAIDLSQTPEPSPQLTNDEPPTPDPSPPERNEGTRRRSGLFGLFHGRHSTHGRPPAVPELAASLGHRRDDSGPSVISVASSGSHMARVQSRSTHRPSFSGSGSVFPAISRSRSRLFDQPNLTSPSMISLNSISAPLSHTLVRTEFTYPRSGPTPDQLRLISSRESFARFGVPYGEDAIAFAASASRMDLSIPPPDFEEVDHLSGAQSRADLGDTVEEVSSTTEHEISEESQTSSHEDGADSVGATSPPPNTTSDSEIPVITTAVPEEMEEPSDSALSESPVDVSHPPGLSVKSNLSSSKSPLSQSSLPVRAESRASSHTSFATAEESLHSTPTTPFSSTSSKFSIPRVVINTGIPEHPDDASQSDAEAEPSTPRMGPTHTHETTDTTIALSPTTPTSSTTEIGQAF